MYREYGYFSGYSHAGFRKLMPRYMADNLRLTTSRKEKVLETEYAQSVMLSCLSTAIACTEAATRKLLCGSSPEGAAGSDAAAKAVADVELRVKLADLWNLVRRSALVGEAIDQLRARHILPPFVGIG